MKIFRLPRLADSAADGSFCLGQGETGSTSVYMLYARIRPGDAPRRLSGGNGAEEIIFVVRGNIRVRRGKLDFVVGPGEAFLADGGAPFELENIGSDEAVFVAAGGQGGQAAEEAVVKGPRDAAAEAAARPEEIAKEEPEFFITRED